MTRLWVSEEMGLERRTGSAIVSGFVLLRGLGGSLLRGPHTKELRKRVDKRDAQQEQQGTHGFDLSDTELM